MLIYKNLVHLLCDSQFLAMFIAMLIRHNKNGTVIKAYIVIYKY